MSGRRQDRIPAPAYSGAGGRNEGQQAPSGTHGFSEDGRGGSTTNARNASADADVMQDVSSVAVSPRGSLSSVLTVVPPARNVLRRLADADEDWAVEGPIDDNVPNKKISDLKRLNVYVYYYCRKYNPVLRLMLNSFRFGVWQWKESQNNVNREYRMN